MTGRVRKIERDMVGNKEQNKETNKLNNKVTNYHHPAITPELTTLPHASRQAA